MACDRGSRGPVVSDAALLRWAPKVYLVVAVGLVPWVVFLALTLPGRAEASHYRLAWVGFDCFLALAIARTAYLGWRRRPQAELGAVVTASLLMVDAWFDITTASTMSDRVEAILLAVFAEIPAAFGSLYLVRRINRIVEAHLEIAGAVIDDTGNEGAKPESPLGPAALAAAGGLETMLRHEESGHVTLHPRGSDDPAPADPVL